MTQQTVIRIGDTEIIILRDGHGRAPNTLFPDFDATRAQAAAAQAGETYDGKTVNVPIMGFAIRRGRDVTLVDAGSPTGYSDTTGAYLDSLAAAGIAAADVTRLAMTHLHIDHVGQIVTDDGARRFPNAPLIAGRGDWDHFFSDAVYARTREGGRERAALDVTRRCLAPYADHLEELDGEVQIAPGLTRVPLPGHTPGHSGIQVSDGGASVLIWGDTIHAAAFQMAEPGWGVLFDVDPAAARATRQALFARLAQDGTPVLGPHVPEPGPWRVETARIGYRLAPA